MKPVLILLFRSVEAKGKVYFCLEELDRYQIGHKLQINLNLI